MDDSEPRTGGLFESLRRLCGRAVSVIENRVELLAVELLEERLRLIEVVLLAGGALVLGGLALVLITGIIVMVFAPGYRLYAAGVLAVLYLAGAAALAFQIKSRLRSPPFPETTAQIKKDVECLTLRK